MKGRMVGSFGVGGRIILGGWMIGGGRIKVSAVLGGGSRANGLIAAVAAGAIPKDLNAAVNSNPCAGV